MIEITNVTPEKIGKLFTKVAIFIFMVIILLKLPDYIHAFMIVRGS